MSSAQFSVPKRLSLMTVNGIVAAFRELGAFLHLRNHVTTAPEAASVVVREDEQILLQRKMSDANQTIEMHQNIFEQWAIKGGFSSLRGMQESDAASIAEVARFSSPQATSLAWRAEITNTFTNILVFNAKNQQATLDNIFVMAVGQEFRQGIADAYQSSSPQHIPLRSFVEGNGFEMLNDQIKASATMTTRAKLKVAARSDVVASVT